MLAGDERARMSERSYRGRFAPSPTGDLHLGGARTALAAWLAARAAGGAFVMRVEDLDGPRVVPGAEERILEDLAWLGLDWDDGPDVGGPHAPYRQSLRLARYDAAVEQLLAAGRAFRCWCSRAEVARAAAAPHGPGDDGPRYPGTCRLRATPAPRDRRPSVRLRVEPEQVAFVDGVHGAYAEDVAAAIGDFVIRRADGIPAYQLAVVVDDAAMGISDVVRGDDLLGSTARQLLLYRALGVPAPRFAHVPLVLGPDGARLSKRHGAVAIRTLRDRGRSASQVVTLLASTLGLGANAGVMPRDLVTSFSLDRITRAPTTLDPAAL
jgi:glutamyl-tRNA synthetase